MTIEDMKDKAYRHGMVNAQVEVDLPLQIGALRKQRGWTQSDLATEAEMKQPRISAMEKPGAVHFTIETLRRMAEAFDVALIVRFAPFSELTSWSESFSPDAFQVLSFEDELGAGAFEDPHWPVCDRSQIVEANLPSSNYSFVNFSRALAEAVEFYGKPTIEANENELIGDFFAGSLYTGNLGQEGSGAIVYGESLQTTTAELRIQ